MRSSRTTEARLSPTITNERRHIDYHHYDNTTPRRSRTTTPEADDEEQDNDEHLRVDNRDEEQEEDEASTVGTTSKEESNAESRVDETEKEEDGENSVDKGVVTGQDEDDGHESEASYEIEQGRGGAQDSRRSQILDEYSLFNNHDPNDSVWDGGADGAESAELSAEELSAEELSAEELSAEELDFPRQQRNNIHTTNPNIPGTSCHAIGTDCPATQLYVTPHAKGTISAASNAVSSTKPANIITTSAFSSPRPENISTTITPIANESSSPSPKAILATPKHLALLHIDPHTADIAAAANVCTRRGRI
ncbi:unnamed protein product [Zymoseptoria tritici ST99CH_1A5]|uniref:Uncharacterized protein n=1 Tax=Zymoseptoria tritici ST99CH_1A5 TaxID=1276529 RepID=A0A1Y6M1F9_ZYMTR|nr:unnamed protein product [Zymoseptoria tritici ST99CH_1A5]